MHGHQHIQGSPFSVRVFEPAPPSVRVYGLDDHKMVGRLANFSSEYTKYTKQYASLVSLSASQLRPKTYDR